MKSYDVTIQMKALCLYLQMVLFFFSKFHNIKFGRNLLLAKFGSERVKNLHSTYRGSTEKFTTAFSNSS